MTIGAFLFERLRQMGGSHVFGVPGDYNLQLLEQMKETQGIEFEMCIRDSVYAGNMRNYDQLYLFSYYRLCGHFCR